MTCSQKGFGVPTLRLKKRVFNMRNSNAIGEVTLLLLCWAMINRWIIYSGEWAFGRNVLTWKTITKIF